MVGGVGRDGGFIWQVEGNLFFFLSSYRFYKSEMSLISYLSKMMEGGRSVGEGEESVPSFWANMNYFRRKSTLRLALGNVPFWVGMGERER